MLKLLQREVATTLGANVASIRNWEANLSNPSFEFIPAVIRFLGYNPIPSSTKWSERLVNYRTALGISQKESANRIGVDPSTLAKWERGERKPAGILLVRLLQSLVEAEAMYSRQLEIPR